MGGAWEGEPVDGIVSKMLDVSARKNKKDGIERLRE